MGGHALIFAIGPDGETAVPLQADASGKLLTTDLGGGSSGAVVVDERVLTTLTDEVSATVTYIAEAAPGSATSAAAWRVRRITKTGTVTLTEWADGGAFSQVADNRASLAYA